MAQKLDLAAALDILDTGRWCSIAFFKHDRKQGTTGEIARIARCRHQAMADAERQNLTHHQQQKITKAPNHRTNQTRNVRLANGSIRKFHIRLLFAINGQKIL